MIALPQCSGCRMNCKVTATPSDILRENVERFHVTEPRLATMLHQRIDGI